LHEKYKQTVIELSILVNDIYSYKKEVKQNDYTFNLVYLKMKAQAISAQQSVDEIVVKMNELTDLYKQYERQLKGFGIKVLDVYVERVWDAYKGVYHWHTISSRYNSDDYDKSWIDEMLELEEVYSEMYSGMFDEDIQIGNQNKILQLIDHKFKDNAIYNSLKNDMVLVKVIAIFICIISVIIINFILK